MKPSSFTLRVVSAFILGPATLALILAGGWFFSGLILLAALRAMFEWARLVENSPHRLTDTVLGAIYLSICFAAFIFTRMGFEQGAWLTLTMLVAVWSSDIGAYFTGKHIGGPKLAPEISPKKTWSGLVGAMFFCGLGLMAMWLLAGPLSSLMNTRISVSGARGGMMLFLSGAILGAVGQTGDLLISYFKRRAHIKDSGSLIPGHGGILDRIDSVMLVSPAFLALVMLWLAP